MTSTYLGLHSYTEKYNGNPAEKRECFIGGSDAGTILGVNPYKSRYQLWLEKTGMVEPADISNDLPVWLGTQCEDIIAKRFEMETGKKVTKSHKTYILKEHPYIRAHIDRKIMKENALLECKRTSARNYIDYEHGDIPPMHYVQMMHYLLCTGFTGSYLSTLRDSDFYINHRTADEKFLEYLLSAEVDFWTHVIAKQPPTDDDSEKYNETLNAMKRMRIEEHKVMHADEKMDALIDQYNRTKDDLAYYRSMEKDTKKTLDRTELEIRKHMIGFDEYEGRNHIVMKPTTRRTLDRDRLNNDHPGLYEQYLKESTTTTMKVIEKETY